MSFVPFAPPGGGGAASFSGAAMRATVQRTHASGTDHVFDVVLYDVGGWVPAGTLNKFVVPEGISKVQAAYYCSYTADIKHNLQVVHLRNGVPVGAHLQNRSAVAEHSVCSVVFEVQPGDEIVFRQSGSSMTTNPRIVTNTASIQGWP